MVNGKGNRRDVTSRELAYLWGWLAEQTVVRQVGGLVQGV